MTTTDTASDASPADARPVGVPSADVPFHVERWSGSSLAAAAAGIAAVIVLASAPAWAGGGTMKLLVEFFTILALAQMWNLLAGYAGLVSIGQQAFVGLGAYALYVGADRLAWHPVAAVLLAGAFCGLVSLATAAFAFRLRDGYFAIGTWVIAEVFRILVSNSAQVGAGTGVSLRSVNTIPLAERQSITYWVALAVGVGSVLVVAAMMRSTLGLRLRAVRDAEVAARGLGVDVLRTRLVVYVVAAAVCGLAGAAAYLQLLRIQPSAAFSVDWTVGMIFIVVIGGLGRIEGPIVGAIVYFLLQEWLAPLGSLYLVVLGGVAIAVTLLAPRGLWGTFEARLPVRLFEYERRLVVDPDAAAPSPARSGGD